MKLPERPVAGKKIRPGWFAEFYDFCASLALSGDQKTILVSRTRHGTAIKGISAGGNTGAAGGTSVKWAKVTAVTDANNYTASIWADRNVVAASETGKALYVYDIADALAVNDWIPVQSSTRTGKDYENIQQLGLL